jgi:putative intracellular protease/amidase
MTASLQILSSSLLILPPDAVQSVVQTRALTHEHIAEVCYGNIALAATLLEVLEQRPMSSHLRMWVGVSMRTRADVVC